MTEVLLAKLEALAKEWEDLADEYQTDALHGSRRSMVGECYACRAAELRKLITEAKGELYGH